MITISIYIQRYILNLLCKEINKLKKDITKASEGECDYNLNKLIESLGLVSHEWYSYISINTITNIFKIKKDEKSMVHKRDIKTIKIDYCTLMDHFYFGEISFNKGYRKSYILEDILKELEYVKNNCFKDSNEENKKSEDRKKKINKLIIRNVRELYYYRPPMYSLPCTPPMKMVQKLKNYFQKIHLYQFEFNDFVTKDNSIKSVMKYVEKLFSIKIKGENYCKNFQEIASTLEHYRESLKMIETDISQTKTYSYPVIEVLSSIFGDSLLISNIESIKINGIISFKEFKICLTELPKLKTLSINLCFYKLLFFLNGIPNQKCCNCFSLATFKQENQYNKEWDEILNLLKLNKTIKTLEIGHLCVNKNGSFVNEEELPINESFYCNISKMIISIKSLDKLTLKNILLPIIFKRVFDISRLLYNHTISEFEIKTFENLERFNNNLFSKSISIFESILSDSKKDNKSIKNIKIINIDSPIEFNRKYNEKVIYNSNK
ncbi:hypothetical protein RB653_010102 [Dictyostelium firmibasis]|uniref:Uncharacterized protein n=1 Tax=Dictyostelium firmibasis TaxID=79012 RepID=A0AAN7U0J5_9MYCE